jgi:hypothetical protein
MRLRYDNCYRRGRTDGWTYFIQGVDGGPIKIGSTVKPPEERIATLQCGSPVLLRYIGLVPGIHKERKVQEFFAEYRLHGEWFDENAPGLLDLIKTLR